MPGPGRVWLAAATFCLAVSGVVVATDGLAAPEPEVTLSPVSTVTCPDVGSYVAPARGSVGLPPGLPLCADGPLTVTEPGTVLDGWEIRGGIVVAAPDVVVRRSRVTGDGTTDYGIVTTSTGSVRVEDTTLTGRFTEAALGGDRWSAERLEVVGVAGDGVHAGAGARLRASVLSRFEPGAETDGIEVRGADVVVEGVEIRMEPGHRSAVAVVPDGGDGPVEISSNVLGGGEWTVLQPDPVGAAVTVRDNRFARDARDGPLRVPVGTVVKDNTFVDGAPVPAA